MRCVVTGGAGFIGSHLVDALIDRGDAVTVLDNLSSGRRENLEWALKGGARLEIVDISDQDAVADAIGAARPEVVFHLAAQIDVRKSVARPLDDAHLNVLGTIAVLEASTRAGARRVINTSSGGAIYGEASTIPTPEDSLLQPMSPYGEGKRAAEGYCELYARTRDLSTVSLRYSNVYGPRQDAHGEGGVVAIFCGCWVEGRVPVIFGDGHQTRDWVEVSDVVRANLLCVDSPVTEPINIGSGRETSVLGLVDALREIRDQGGPDGVTFAPPREGELLRSCLDVSRARERLRWEPTIELSRGLRRILAGDATPTQRLMN